VDTGSRLTPIFLMSLPRSGSTLLQRVLGAAPEISTVSEPWFLLPPLYALRPEGIEAEYKHSSLVAALEDLCAQLPGGRSDYLSAVRAFALDLYGRLADPGASFFVDKTPRYHLIAEELFETFPEARFVFIWRNPLAVAASIHETWSLRMYGRWDPYRWDVDLHAGVRNLVDAYRRHGDRSVAVSFESLVRSPEVEFRHVFDYLGLPFDPAYLSQFADVRLEGRMGDEAGKARYSTVAAAPAESWTNHISTPTRRRWAERYVEWIGAEDLATMGYDRAELRATLTTLGRGRTRLREMATTARGETEGWVDARKRARRSSASALSTASFLDKAVAHAFPGAGVRGLELLSVLLDRALVEAPRAGDDDSRRWRPRLDEEPRGDALDALVTAVRAAAFCIVSEDSSQVEGVAAVFERRDGSLYARLAEEIRAGSDNDRVS